MRRAGSTWAVIAFVTVVGVALAAPSFASTLSLQPTSQGLLPASKAVSGIAAGDFNGDGADDLAVAKEGGVMVWLSNGDGTFTKGETLSDGLSDNTAVVVGDFNGDGKLDLAYSYAFGRVAIALGNGNGTFQPAVQVAESPSLPFYIRDHQLAVGDFEGNGRDEIVVVGSFTNLTVEEGEYQVIADEGGAFTAKSPVNFPIAAESEVVGVAVGDYNDDGDQDLALLDRASNVTNYTRDSIYGEVGQGNDTFVPTANPISLAFASYALPWTETTANLNGSGGDDLLVSTAASNGMIPLLGSSTEFLAPDPGGTPQGFTESFGAPAAADLTGDGLDDAISGFARGDASGVNGGLDIALADGSGG